jgi:hypothetical protein
MKIVIFGASGMVGGGLLLEALKDADVTEVVVVGRSPVGLSDTKLREVLVSDLAVGAREISGMDACFFTVGVTASGKNEAEYTRLTYDLTLSVAEALVENNPAMVFLYVSGQGTGGDAMWARVKRRTEDALLAMPFRAAYMFRPGFIVPVGVKSKTKLYQRIYTGIEIAAICAFGFPGLFAIGAFTGIFFGVLGMDIHLTETYFIVAHFNVLVVCGLLMTAVAGLYFFWPRTTGHRYPNAMWKFVAIPVFLGFILTFSPQFIVGYLGMPRRYHAEPAEHQFLNVLSTAGTTLLAVGYVFFLLYWGWSLREGKRPVLSLIRRMFPKSVVNSDELGRVMLKVAKIGFGKRVLETGDIAQVMF